MKGSSVALCLFFVILFGIVVYTHYDTRKFIESLPQLSATQNETTFLKKAENVALETAASEDAQTSTDTVSDLDPVLDLSNYLDTEKQVHSLDSPVKPTPGVETDVMIDTEETVEQSLFEDNPPPGWVPWRRVESSEIVIDREAFLADVGNTPEAHTYLALHRIIHMADSYTHREIYEYMLLEKAFTQNPAILPEHLEQMRKRAAQAPDALLPSWKVLKNNPNITIRERDK